MKTQVLDINPVPKCRMTQRDKRLPKRPCVARYHAFKDQIRLNCVEIPESGSHITFCIPMPKSWPKKKKAEMLSKPHQNRPDADNLLKSILDAVHLEDCHIWDIRVSKIWSSEGRIIIKSKE